MPVEPYTIQKPTPAGTSCIRSMQSCWQPQRLVRGERNHTVSQLLLVWLQQRKEEQNPSNLLRETQISVSYKKISSNGGGQFCDLSIKKWLVHYHSHNHPSNHSLYLPYQSRKLKSELRKHVDMSKFTIIVKSCEAQVITFTVAYMVV